MPSSSFDRDVLKTSVAQICHSLGWNSMQKSSLSVLTDVLERYMKTLSTATAGYCQNSCRTDINLNDLGIAFDQLGIQICELEDYVHQVESIHFPKTVPQFQSGISTAIQFPAEEEFTSREEWYDEHMPSLGKNIKGNEPEVKNEEEAENNEMEVQTMPSVDSNETPLDTIPNKRPMESPVIEPKIPWDNKLFLPDLVRPELPRFKSLEDPMILKQSSFSPSTPVTPMLAVKREGSPLKNLEKQSAISLQDRTGLKESSKVDVLSPKPAKRPKVLSPPSQLDDIHQKSEDVAQKHGSKRPETLALDDRPKDSYLNKEMFLPNNREARSSPISKVPSTMKSPSPEKASHPHRVPGTPFLEWPHNQPSPKLELEASLSDKKSKTKKAKKAKKAKNTPSKKGSNKSKQNISRPISSSPQLFGSPHILKSPPEQRMILASQTNIKESPKSEGKIDHNISPYHEKTPTTPEVKTKIFHSTPYEEDAKYVKGLTGAKKQSSKKAKKHPVSSVNVEIKEKSPLSLPEKPQLFASLPLTKLPKHDSFRSPAGIASPGVKSSTYNVAVSQSSTLNSYEYKTTEAKPVVSSKAEKKVNKKEEKKRKKDKKNKKKPCDEEPKVQNSQSAKSETPSLKVTFKRAPSGAYNDQQIKDATPTLKVHSLSPAAISHPVETPTYPFETSPKKVVSPPAEPKSRKPKKVKTSAKKPEPMEKRAEPAVRIEPLVINESYNKPDYMETYDLTVKPEAKQVKSSKKEVSGKKGKPTKKADSGKKAAKKKPETAKKPPKAKANEVYQPDQYYSSPPPVTLTGEQSVSRGLFIQTITEPTTTQVWYCPACLRPDDGSPMIGCDSCDGWYHWTCVGITQAPSEDVEWYCGTCVDRLSKKKIKKRKKKD